MSHNVQNDSITNLLQDPTRSVMINSGALAGSINEGGIINDLKRRGFTLFNCLCEIIANSIDAKCTKFRFVITADYIKIIDDGSGMNLQKLKDMFDMLKSNHLNDKSMGVSGLGGKAATLTLSKEKNVIIYTFDGEKYLTANVPWGDIVKQQKYIDMIKIYDMNDESVEDFKNDREGKGTSILLPYDNHVHEEIVKNFNDERLMSIVVIILFYSSLIIYSSSFLNI